MNLEQYIQPIVDYVREHQAWAAPLVFALCFAESLAFISLLIPAWGVLVGLGALVSASGLSFWPLVIAGALGAALGDWLSYWVGLKLENRVYHMWPLVAAPASHSGRREFHQEMGLGRDLHRALLRAAARLGADRRGRVRDAVLAVSGRQFHLGLRVGLGAAVARRRHLDVGQMVRRPDRQVSLPKTACRDEPGRAPIEQRQSSVTSPH